MADASNPDEVIQYRMVTKITLAKFDGEAPQEGEDKEPVEVIEIVDEGFPSAPPAKE